MSDKLMLTGNLPVNTPEEAFRVFGKPLGPYLPAMPDGEAGYRNFWVGRLMFQVFHGNPDIDTVSRPLAEDGSEVLAPGVSKGPRQNNWKFRLKDGIAEPRFADPGWRLGFTYDAITSYSIFRLMREKGELAQDLRFQVSIPLINSTINQSRFQPDQLVRIRRGYQKALIAEVREIVKRIPNEDLAITWDCSYEISDIHAGVEGATEVEVMERNVSQFRDIMPLIPEQVVMGVHLCLGTSTGWPRFTPPDLGKTVEIANAIIAESGRKMDWIHIPVLPEADDHFVAPLKKLNTGNTRIYLGLIHNMDGFKHRFDIARRALPEFGLAGYCGFGGGRRTKEESQRIIDDHLRALELAKMS